MNSLFVKAEKQVEHLKNEMASLEQNENVALQGQIGASLSTLARLLGEVDEMARREPSSDKREQFKLRVNSLQREHQSLKRNLERIQVQFRERALERSRNELLHRQVPSESSSSSYPVDFQQKEKESLNYTGTKLDEYIGIGMATLDSLSRQKQTLKATHRKILDVANILGISQSLIRVIDIRHRQDKWMFYGGALLVLSIIYFVIFWL